MKRMRKYLIRTLLGVAAVVAAGFAATSCSDDSDSGSGVFRVEWDPTKTVHPDREGAAVLIVDGREGTSWRAEITAGADWVSFNRTAPGGQTVKTGIAGTSLAARNQYVYYWPNDTRGERHAMIRFTFDGQAPLELELDFSEEEVEFADRAQLREAMQRIGAHIDALRNSFTLGNAIKEGVAVAITGAPNVGKSTLLNRLLNEERVLVSDIAGTTRDVIEERINIDGVVFRFLDTAGIRATDDRLEQMGIQRTMSSIERAQIVIYMTDAARLAAGAPVAPEFPLRADQKLLVLVNKTDTAPDCPLPEGTIGISARNGDGIESLRRILRSFVDTEALYHGDAIVSNNRHYEALTAAGDALRRALDGLNNSLQTDLLSEEIRQVIHHVGSVTGRNSLASEEVLKHIFSKHCVGK